MQSITVRHPPSALASYRESSCCHFSSTFTALNTFLVLQGMGNALPAANRERLHLRNLACSLGRMPREDCREAKRQGQEDEAVRERERGSSTKPFPETGELTNSTLNSAVILSKPMHVFIFSQPCETVLCYGE